MVMKKEWWYVIALVAIILVVMVVFKGSVGLAPGKVDAQDSLGSDELSAWAIDNFGSSTDDESANSVLRQLQKAVGAQR